MLLSARGERKTHQRGIGLLRKKERKRLLSVTTSGTIAVTSQEKRRETGVVVTSLSRTVHGKGEKKETDFFHLGKRRYFADKRKKENKQHDYFERIKETRTASWIAQRSKGEKE